MSDFFGLRKPERLLQPWKDLRQFTQELYAMMVHGGDQGGPTAPEPVPARLEPGAGPARRPPDPPRVETGEPTAPGVRPRVTASTDGPARRADEPSPAREPAAGRPEVRRQLEGRRAEAAEPFRFEARPTRARAGVESPDSTPRRDAAPAEAARSRLAEAASDTPFPAPTAAPASATAWLDRDIPPNRGVVYDPPTAPITLEDIAPAPIFIGRAAQDGGQEVLCDLYAQGPEQGPTTSDPVTVKVLQLHPDDTIKQGTWIYGIWLLGVDDEGNPLFYAKPPMWEA